MWVALSTSRVQNAKFNVRAGYVISAIFVCAEYQRLGVHFRQHRVLRVSFWIKLGFILVEGLCHTYAFVFFGLLALKL